MPHVTSAAPVVAAHDAQDADTDSPCPGHSAVTSTQHAHSAASSESYDPGQPRHGQPGCCGSNGCAATCLHAPAAIAVECYRATLPAHRVPAQVADAAHASPA